MKFWVWDIEGEKPDEPTYEGRKETDAAIAYVREQRAKWAEWRNETLVRVDDEFGHRYEFRVNAFHDIRFTVESIDE